MLVVRVDLELALVNDGVLPENDDDVKRLVAGLLLMVDEIGEVLDMQLDVVEEEVVVDVTQRWSRRSC